MRPHHRQEFNLGRECFRQKNIRQGNWTFLKIIGLHKRTVENGQIQGPGNRKYCQTFTKLDLKCFKDLRLNISTCLSKAKPTGCSFGTMGVILMKEFLKKPQALSKTTHRHASNNRSIQSSTHLLKYKLLDARKPGTSGFVFPKTVIVIFLCRKTYKLIKSKKLFTEMCRKQKFPVTSYPITVISQ